MSLALCLASAFMLRTQPLYAVMFYGQTRVLRHGDRCTRLARGQSDASALARLSGFFVLVNVAAGQALLQWLAGVRQELWEPTRRPG